MIFSAAIASFLSCVLFIYDTYLPSGEPTPLWLFTTELTCSVFFANLYFFYLWAAPDKIAYILGLQGMVDVLTVTPVLAIAFTGSCDFGAVGSALGFFRVLKFTRVSLQAYSSHMISLFGIEF